MSTGKRQTNPELAELSRKRKPAHKKLMDMGSATYQAFPGMGGGRATVSARFALEVMDQVFGLE